MKTITIIAVLLLTTNSIFSQVDYSKSGKGGPSTNQFAPSLQSILLRSNLLNELENNNTRKVLGSPYWSEGWSKGTIIT
jgi:hypothetical protein